MRWAVNEGEQRMEVWGDRIGYKKEIFVFFCVVRFTTKVESARGWRRETTHWDWVVVYEWRYLETLENTFLIWRLKLCCAVQYELVNLKGFFASSLLLSMLTSALLKSHFSLPNVSMVQIYIFLTCEWRQTSPLLRRLRNAMTIQRKNCKNIIVIVGVRQPL